ncbi:hypothetical protein NECAME_08464 [Necator americanus]|uniref:Uncharacterized protein n=1 Tax=Necator americanus TaxID=51031 RepID=W2TJY8_NECAM|nr:hypothetical protein NECAME_08464 [Necator americanus]ETN81496.1 hypothetical protein NECAME_08464 [Necator americanus]
MSSSLGAWCDVSAHIARYSHHNCLILDCDTCPIRTPRKLGPSGVCLKEELLVFVALDDFNWRNAVEDLQQAEVLKDDVANARKPTRFHVPPGSQLPKNPMMSLKEIITVDLFGAF